MRNIFLTVIASIFSTIISAQETKLYSFTHYTTSAGLLSEQVSTTVQDEDGYIWIGGTDGLQRYDGTRYKTFKHRSIDPRSISSNGIVQLIFDKTKRLWVLLADGSVDIFDTKQFTFTKVAVKPKADSSFQAISKRLSIDEDGNMYYLLAMQEVMTWNEKKFEFSYEHNFFRQKDNWRITDFVKQPGTKKYWIGIKDVGIAIYNMATGKLSYPGNNVENEPIIDLKEKSIPSNMLFDKQGRLWYIYWPTVFPQIFCYNIKTNVMEKYELLSVLGQYHEVAEITQHRDGSIWIYGLKVFAKFLEKEKKFQSVYNGYTNENSISFEAISSLYEDREGNVWVSTNNNGLYRFNPSKEYFINIQHANHLSKQIGKGSPMSFINTKRNTILVGTWEDGLYEYDSNFNPISTNKSSFYNGINCFIWNMIASADSNTLWLAAQPGLYAIDQAKHNFSFYNPPILQQRTTAQVAEDKAGDLWLGMFHFGVFKWKVNKGKKLNSNDIERFMAIPNHVGVNKMIIDKDGLLWIGTKHDGAYVINTVTEKVVMRFTKDATNEFNLPEEGVSSILEYNDSTMILTTSTRIVVYNTISKKISLYGMADVISGNITAMEKDGLGYIWITTTSSLYRINPKTKLFVHFGREDGIQNNSFVLSASKSLADGRILFGSSNQFIVFEPSKIQTHFTVNPKITITDFEVMNKHMSVDSLLKLKEIDLDYKQNLLNISFSPLTYSSFCLIQYQLKGLDKGWNTEDKDMHAVYSYLPPGSYTLVFRTIDGDGNITPSDEEYVIKINPPFYRTWLFYGLSVLAFGGLLFWFDKERMKRKETVQKMRANIAGNLHQDVNTALNNINILSEMASLKADAEPQKSKEFIEQIHTKSYNMITAMDDMLWSISPENDSMDKTIERMREYIDALNQRHAANFEMLVDDSIKSLKLDMQFRHEAFLLFKESINGLVNACAVNCKIHVMLERPNLLFSIQFSHRKCDLQQLNNLLQRQDMTKRLNAINATLHVEMLKANAVFELSVPVT